MKIYALYEKDNTGKTTVIKSVCSKLKSKHRVLFSKNIEDDVCFVFEINGKIVGVTSYGDNKAVLLKPFHIFEDYKCEIVVAATRIRRTASGSVKYIEIFAKEHSAEVIWIKKVYVDVQKEVEHKYKEEIDSINKKTVEQLFDLIEKS